MTSPGRLLFRSSARDRVFAFDEGLDGAPVVRVFDLTQIHIGHAAHAREH
ncbi:hypothetical protein [Paracoccus sp. IB05]|nr:hypothetical protein [Paracoccus sp. IB05]MBJ2150681.1 hypothetical protein [Paracoccus sp. IB05]